MRRIFTVLIALVLTSTWATAQSVIYSQMGDLAGTSMYFNSNFEGYNNAASADDITVPAGGWILSGASVVFEGTTEKLEITIYNDDSGKPGTTHTTFEITTWEEMSLLSGAATKYSFNFGQSVVLTEGTYWFSVRKKGYNGYWLLSNETTAIGAKAQQKMIGGFGSQEWGEVSDWYNNYGMYNNLAFELYTVVDNDLSVKSIISPVNGELSESEKLSVAIQNGGLNTQNSYVVNYQVSSTVDGIPTELVGSGTKTISTTILSGAIDTVDFTEILDMSEMGFYSIFAEVILDGDEGASNDKQTTLIENYGEIHVMGSDKVVTSCNGRFIDDGMFENPYTTASSDTIVFYPSNEGDMVVVDFTYMNIGTDNEVFNFYNGENTNASLLFDYVGLSGHLERIVARNPKGAITVVVGTKDVTSGYDGWEASISCTTPNAVEFMALDFTVGQVNDLFKVGMPVTAQGVVVNTGTSTTTRKVFLTVNGVPYQTISTDTLVLGATDTIEFSWIPSIIDTKVAMIIESDPQETNDDNMLDVEVDVYNDVMIENFETTPAGELPNGWVSTENKSSSYKYAYYAYDGDYSLKYGGGNDTVIMPLMNPKVDNILSFHVRNLWREWVEVLYAKDINGPWTVLDSAKYVTYQSTYYEFEISQLTDGPYYFALTSNQSNFYVDFIMGAELFYYESDIKAESFMTDSYFKAGNDYKIPMLLSNVGTMDILGTDYNVEVKTADSTYYIVDGIDINSMKSETLNAIVNFTTLDTLDLYYEIVMNGETRVDNNMSSTATVAVTDKYITEGELYTTNYNMISLYGNSTVSEMIYYPSDIGAYGNLKGIEFTYTNTYGVDYDSIPLTFYIATITDSLLVDTVGSNGATYFSTPSWIETDSIDFTTVFKDTVTLKQGTKNTMYIPFDEPFAYDGTENLIVLVHKDSTDLKYKRVYVDAMKSNDHYRFAYGYDYSGKISTDSIAKSLSSNRIDKNYLANYKWHFENTGTPVFESTPVTTVDEFETYTYNIEIDYESATSFEVVAEALPEWLTLEAVNDTLFTLSGNTVPGSYDIKLTATDGSIYSAFQEFNITANAVPVFVSNADTLTLVNEVYEYVAEVTYNGRGFASLTGGANNPTWAIVTDNGDNTATLSGTPDVIGNVEITITAEGDVTVSQSYTLTVSNVPVFSSMVDEVIKETTDYSVTITVDDATATITTSDDHSADMVVTDNEDGTATVVSTALAVGEYVVHVIADNGNYSSEMSYTITAGAVPVFTSEPVTTALRNEVYTYDVVVTYNGDDAVMLSADVPAWITFTDNGDGTANLTGTPTSADSNIFTVSIITAGEYYFATQTFSGYIDPNAINSVYANAFNIYPNPAKNFVMVTDADNATIEICDITGKLMFTKAMISGNERIDVSELNNGIYIISMTNNNVTSSKRLVIE